MPVIWTELHAQPTLDVIWLGFHQEGNKHKEGAGEAFLPDQWNASREMSKGKLNQLWSSIPPELKPSS